jgi:hypothetical protein
VYLGESYNNLTVSCFKYLCSTCIGSSDIFSATAINNNNKTHTKKKTQISMTSDTSGTVHGNGELYDTAADIGVGFATIKLIISEIVACILACIGIYLITHPESQSKETTGIVTSVVDYGPIVGSAPPRNSFSVNTQYTCNNELLTSVLSMQSPPGSYAPGTEIKLQYNPNNCGDVRVRQTPNATVGYALLSVGAFLGIAAGVWWYVVKHNKAIAAISGASDVLNVVTSGFKRR